MRCAVFGCDMDDGSKNYKKGDVMFFRFPKDAQMCKAWQHACGRKDSFNVANARVCSKHFKDSDYVRNLKHELLGYSPRNLRLIKPEVIPNEKLPRHSSFSSSSVSASKRQERAAKRNCRAIVKKLLVDKRTENQNGNGGSCSSCYEGEGMCLDKNDNLNNILTTDRGTNTEVDNRDAIIAELKNKLAQAESDSEAVKKFFTSAQLKKFKNPNGRVRWSIEDISNAIVIHSAGPRAYRLLLKKGFPLPAVSTIRNWAKKIKITPGILKPVLDIIKLKEMNTSQRVCVLSFDEIKIRKCYLYDKANDETLRPFSYAQVVMLRGLFSNWKQPVFYDYDCKMTKHLLFDIINYVEQSGFHIVAMVSDLGGGNRSLHTELGLSIEKTWFQNPVNGHNIHVFADVPHLVKLIRNHFVDHGFIINDKEISSKIVEKLLDITSESDLSIAHKISKATLNVRNAGRQKVKWATKLFSHTLSCAMTRCGINGQLNNENWLECAEFMKLVNDWFDCLNVRVPTTDSRERTKAYGLSLSTQNIIVNKMTETITNMRVKGKSTLLPFQKGIIMTNRSLQLLYSDLTQRFDTKYILTYRLNQDVLESFFGVIRAKGGLHDHPDPLEFRYRLRSYILGKNEGSLSLYGNVEEDTTPDLPEAHLPVDINLSAKCFTGLLDEESQTEEQEDPHLNELTDVVYDGLENLAGFICHKLKEPSNTSLERSSYSWIDHLSEGGLTKPSPAFMYEMEQLEKTFNEVNLSTIKITKNYLKDLLNKSINVPCSEKSKKLFFRSRMFFRMRHLNKELTDSSASRKRKLKKTVQ